MYDLIVIGAGPAGISMAVEATNSGVPADKILVLEKAKEHSWTIRKFYPEAKEVTANYKGAAAVCYGVMCINDTSKSGALSYLDQAIVDHQIEVNYNCDVFKIEKAEDVFTIQTSKGSFESKVCVVAIGVFGKPNKPSYKIPSALRKKVHFDINSDALKASESIVIGGGDSAAEYAQYLVQEGCSVTFSYRRSELTRMNEVNKESLLWLAEHNKVNLLLESNVEALEAFDDRVKVIFTEEIEPVVVDHVVYALGGTTPSNFLKHIGIRYSGDAPHLEEGFETSIQGLFLVGDLASGKRGGSIIAAFNSSRATLDKICDSYLDCSTNYVSNNEESSPLLEE